MDYSRLRAAALQNGEDEEAVTVDTRALIDKVLARYSGEWTTLRELVQNAADAQATWVKIKWETLPSTSVALPPPSSTSRSDMLKHVLAHHTLRRLVVENNGQPFTRTDWGRLKRIAEGNPDETKIGAFGVGFYSVFADCEEPFVSSGPEAMAFYWKGNALFTRKMQLPPDQASPNTAFVLDYRNTTTPLPKLLSVSQFLATSLTFVALQGIEFWIDDYQVLGLNKKTSPSQALPVARDLETRTKEGLMELVSVEQTSVQIDATFMSVVGWKPQTATSAGNKGDSYGAEVPSLRSFFSRLAANATQSGLRGKTAKEEKATQDAIAEDLTLTSTSSIFLRVTAGQLKTNVSASFATELERATKKPPPKTTKLSILTSSYDETLASETSSSATQVVKAADVFSSVLPGKKPGGRIFIGFPTTQTTGAGMHISAPSVIPTVEREAIDLNARWVRTWNMEMLRAAGIMTRLAFANEMADLNDKLLRKSGQGKGGISIEDVRHGVPEALHILKTYSFGDSTPSAHVSQIMEEAFWTSVKRPTIEVYSSRGVLPSSKVRTASEELSKFVSGIPVILDEMQDAPLVRKLTDFGLIEAITVDDVCQELGSKALDKDQLHHFIAWAGKGAATGELDHPSKQRVLNAAVATVGEGPDSGHVVALGSIKNYVGAGKIAPTLPIPPTTLPAAFTANLPVVHLQALGWEPLDMVPWLRFIIETGPSMHDEQNLTKSSKFAVQVLGVLSKNWDNLNLSSRNLVVAALQNTTCMPTKTGMKKPAEAFFPSVKLFNDLPVVQGCGNIKEKFLVALGVRKTVDLDTIFTRLLSTSPDGRKPWSHMELIKYLASVKDDIPADDLKKLRESRLCPAEAGPPGLEPTKGSAQSYKVSELYEPKDALRALKLPLLHWPGPPGSYRASSAEGRFLHLLGLRPYPSVPELVDMMASPDAELAARAMGYFIDSHQINNYAAFDMGRTSKAIMPVQGSEKKLVAPSACYTNESAKVLGYKVLRADLHAHASKFGVARDPPMTGCVDRLLANAPRDRDTALRLFTYFTTRVGHVTGNDLARLKNAAIVPVVRPKQPYSGLVASKGETETVLVRAQDCYLGQSAAYGAIFDFVDYGNEANPFLFQCGAKTEPTKAEIARMACSEPARLLGTLQSPEKYMDLLKSLADHVSTLKSDRELFRNMRTSAWLLASRDMASSGADEEGSDAGGEDAPIRQYQLAAPSQIVILDDYISYRLFKDSLLCAPEEDSLEAFYMALGSETLGSKVHEDVQVGRATEKQEGAEWLRGHVLERSKLFLHEYARYRQDVIKHDAKWLEKKLKVAVVKSVALVRTLKGQRRSHTEKRSAASVYRSTDGATVLYVAAAQGAGHKPDMYQIGQAICQLLLTRHGQHAYFFFEPFLKLDLLQLRARGYNVDRILRAKAAEARVAEEERRKALEVEQQKVKEMEQEWQAQTAQAAVAARQQQQQQQQQQQDEQQARPKMPGGFEDSRDFEAPHVPTTHSHKSGRRGLFSNLTRRLGLETDNHQDDDDDDDGDARAGKRASTSLLPPPQPLPPGPGTSDNGRVTSPAVVRQNLLNAIGSTRAHDSANLFSPPQQATVKEQATYCDSTPAQNMVLAADAPGGTRIFLAHNALKAGEDRTDFMARHASAIGRFEGILKDVAGVYGLPARAMHMFFDGEGGTIAFNAQGSVFCNLRYFLQLHDAKMAAAQQGQQQPRVEAATWWWVVVAHELAHNLVSLHNADHSYYTESFIQQFFPNMMALAAGWLGRQDGVQREVQPQAQPAVPPPPYQQSLLD